MYGQQPVHVLSCFALFHLIPTPASSCLPTVFEMESIDWNLCIICSEGGGDLRCPADSLQNNGIDVYNGFIQVVEEFHKLEALPVNVKFEGENIAQ